MKIDTTLNIDIRGLTSDSRKVEPGFLFAALPGTQVDGRDFIPDAIRNGARAVLAPAGTQQPDGSPIALLTDPNPRRAFAKLAARFYGRQPELVCAVTGTNGKTSVAQFAAQIMNACGTAAGSLGTLGAHAPGFDLSGQLTTPDPVHLHEVLADLVEAGTQAVVMEASSHGLDQCRLDGVRVSVAGFTNLSRDHLDYHGTMEIYLAAKQRLFSEVLLPGGIAVLNADIPEFEALSDICTQVGHKVLSYGTDGTSLKLVAATASTSGTDLHLEVMGKTYRLTLPLMGTFQVANALCALGMALAAGEKSDAAVAALEHIEPVAGRLEPVAKTDQGAPVVVDYAHTPDGLSAALSALRPHTKGKLCVVFGAGGDRDPGKRLLMGQVAADLADRVIVTDDNPRCEDPAQIRKAILEACPDALEVGDRKDAIAAGLEAIGPEDVLLVAGKGHETGQIVGDTVLPFNDADVIRALLGKAG